jgi:hypothetical protein
MPILVVDNHFSFLARLSLEDLRRHLCIALDSSLFFFSLYLNGLLELPCCVDERNDTGNGTGGQESSAILLVVSALRVKLVDIKIIGQAIGSL